MNEKITSNSATDVKIDYIVKEIQELRAETKSLREDINKGKGAVWLLLVIAGLIASVYNFIQYK